MTTDKAATTGTAAPVVDRAALATDLANLRQEHEERMVPLDGELAAAQTAYSATVEKLEAARGAVGSAHSAKAEVTSRYDRERGLVERSLRDSAPAVLAGFREWCRERVSKLSVAPPGHVPDRDARLMAAHGALQQLEAIALLPEEEMTRRLAELRAAIEPTGVERAAEVVAP